MQANIRVGPAGWSYKDWNGVVYPRLRPAGFHEASYLASYFPLIEINTSFYRPLRPELARLWVRKVEHRRDFQFTVKLYRGFTHERTLLRGEVKQFSDGIAPLAETGRLGCLLMQFPWAFRLNKENREYVVRLKRAFGHFPLVAEFRHSSWNSHPSLDLLIDQRIGFCNIDQPQMDHCLPPTAHVTSPVGYVRFHGRNYQEWLRHDSDANGRSGIRRVDARSNYLYSRKQLAKWKTRIDQIAGQARRTYVVTSNHFQGKAVVNALDLIEMTNEEPVEAPLELLAHYPELHAIAKTEPVQRSLFMPVSRSRYAAASGAGPVLVTQ